MQFIFSKEFEKNLKAFVHQPKRMEHIILVVDDFKTYLFQSIYYRKKLHGYENVHELEVGGDIRIFVKVLIEADCATFLNVGTHSSLGITGDQKKKLW